jgi:3-hydroxyisobutyrate dehydrogenase-like beta-hydroxyacid dehydrogenase
MEIGTIGAGAFAQAFAKRALKAGHKVKLSNSRGPEISWSKENTPNESHPPHYLR